MINKQSNDSLELNLEQAICIIMPDRYKLLRQLAQFKGCNNLLQLFDEIVKYEDFAYAKNVSCSSNLNKRRLIHLENITDCQLMKELNKRGYVVISREQFYN